MIQKNVPIGQIIIETDLVPDDAYLPNGKKSREIKEINGHLVMEAIAQAANRKNRNGRYYEDEELFPEASCPRTQELIKSGNMKSENGHPLSKDLIRQQTIDPNNTVAVIDKMWPQDEFIMIWYHGDFNQIGDDLDRQIRSGQIPSWSLRALGTLVPSREGTKVKNMKMITYDRVHYPSHPEAYTTGPVYESAMIEQLEMYCQEGSRIIVPKDDPGLVIPIVNEDVINYIKSESANLKYLQETFDFMYNNIEISKNKYTGQSTVTLTDNQGQIFMVNLESYISDDIMNYCLSKI